uniref:Uncharacterized protein n=1 Tax=Siphoviridae sp. ctvI513 TaxID=2827965 RepID=A0A8S5TK20_9CAUD|nr:MAG TPA: hypothetical protein [Siphoviridae sp. ctvI513]
MIRPLKFGDRSERIINQQWKQSHCALIIANRLSFRKLFKEIL